MTRAEVERLAVEKLGPGAIVFENRRTGEWTAERIYNGKRHRVSAKGRNLLGWVLGQIGTARVP